MSQFQGDRTISLPPDIVSARLSDAGFLAGCLDNLEQVTEATPDRAAWKVRTGFSFLSTSLDVTLTVTDRAGDRTGYEIFSKGVGASSRVRAVLTFGPVEAGTLVHYEAEVVERTGLLKVVSPGLIQAAAGSVIQDTWKGIEARLQADAGGRTIQPPA